MTRPYPWDHAVTSWVGATWDICAAMRWPRLMGQMQTTAILSEGEAAAALRDYIQARDGEIAAELALHGGGEAVCHYGGPRKVIRAAIRERATWRSIHGGVYCRPYHGLAEDNPAFPAGVLRHVWRGWQV